MIKTHREKTLEARIARLEKLVKESTFSKNEDLDDDIDAIDEWFYDHISEDSFDSMREFKMTLKELSRQQDDMSVDMCADWTGVSDRSLIINELAKLAKDDYERKFGTNSRFEKLVKSTERATNESLPRSGMTLGEILALYTGNSPDDFGQIIDDLAMTDTLYFIADAAGISESDADAYVEDLWDEPCRVRINQGASSGGSDEVTVIVDGISFVVDWMDDTFEECSRSSHR